MRAAPTDAGSTAPMTGPSEVSVARVAPDLAEGSWADLRQTVAGDDPRTKADEFLCCVAVFGHGNGVLDGIDRVCRALAMGMPAELLGRVAVQGAPSTEPDADTPGTL